MNEISHPNGTPNDTRPNLDYRARVVDGAGQPGAAKPPAAPLAATPVNPAATATSAAATPRPTTISPAPSATAQAPSRPAPLAASPAPAAAARPAAPAVTTLPVTTASQPSSATGRLVSAAAGEPRAVAPNASAELASAAPALLEKVVQGAHDTVDHVADRAAPVVRRLGERVSAAEDALHARTDQLRQVRDEWTAGMRSTVRGNPLLCVAGAVAVGALIARLRR